MNAKHIELWRRVEQFQLDSPESVIPFSARLCRENNWPKAYTERAIAEYKRFAFLAMVAGHPVSPSETVDQAWHLHLTYSENYWKVFCPEVLCHALHHHPSKGGPTEKSRFDDWYAQTLASYKEIFEEAPPGDIWPAPEVRRQQTHDFIRVDRKRNWIIPKPCLRISRKFLAQLGLPTIALVCSGAMVSGGANVFDWRGPKFIEFYVILLACCLGAGLWLRKLLRRPLAVEPLKVPELDGYTTAYLNGGKVLTVNTAIANLVRQNALRVDARNKRLTSLVPEPQFGHELERLVYDSAASTDGTTIAEVRSSAKAFVGQISEGLKARGLVVADSAARKAIVLPLLVALVALLVGIIKISIGLSRGKPVGFLVGLCLVTLLFALVAFARRPLRSRYGDAVLKQLQERHIGPRSLGKNMAAIPSAEFATVVGLFGLTALAGTEFADLRRSLQPPAGDGGGCGGDCGGGCGGGCGGCGGGCGGCGGD
jgi:uncharacterized protein (TIGR04222 family)